MNPPFPVGQDHPDPATETGCRHCAAPIRKQRDPSGNGLEWVSAVGVDAAGTWRYSRICRDMETTHAPIPIGNPVALEQWLAQ